MSQNDFTISATIQPQEASPVAYLSAADNVSGPLSIRLPLVNQSVISTPNVFSTLLPSLLADI
jgi:hypothetical protein